jgi:hypothetical protein
VFPFDFTSVPGGELGKQPAGDASLHDHAAAFVFDALDLTEFMEEGDQRALLVRQAVL